MKATTIKLQGRILDEIEAHKPADQSMTAYVRDAVRRDIRRHVLREAAEAYLAHLEEHPEEAAWTEAWAQADLASPPRPDSVEGRSGTGRSRE